MVEVRVEDQDLRQGSRIETEGIHLGDDVRQDVGQPAIDQDSPFPPLEEVDARLLPSQVPEPVAVSFPPDDAAWPDLLLPYYGCL